MSDIELTMEKRKRLAPSALVWLVSFVVVSTVFWFSITTAVSCLGFIADDTCDRICERRERARGMHDGFGCQCFGLIEEAP
jgi:hypothetical protein